MSALLGAGDAEAGGRNGFEALRGNLLAAALALAVRAPIDAAEGGLDVVQVLDQAFHEGENLGPLGGRLRGVGEALVQEDLDRAVGLGAELCELLLDLDQLRLQPLPGLSQYVIAERQRILPCRQALNRTGSRSTPTRRSLQLN